MRERRIADIRLDEMSAAFEEAKRAGRWDEKRKCYTDSHGNLVVDSKCVDCNAEELYSKKFKDKNYIPNMENELEA
ncbi:hypothetical protein Hanom_Chr10g00912011 [Helianthus anomalus]